VKTIIAGVLAAGLATPLLVAQQAPAAANRQLIVEFFGFRGSRQDRANRFMAEDYVQHNPRFLKMDRFTGARGRQAWVAAGEEAARRGNLQLVALGGIPLRDPVILMAEGDLAHAVYRGTLADPDEPGKRYEAFAFETFRFRNGQFVEHWDQVRLTAGWMAPRPQTPPPAAAAAPANPPAAPPAVEPVPRPGCSIAAPALAANKQLVRNFFNGVPNAQNVRAKAALLAPDYVQHNPRFGEFNEKNNLSGRDGFIKAIESGILNPAANPAATAAPAPRTLEEIVGECDYVSVLWKQVLPDPDDPAMTWEAFTFDTFRVQNNLLAEHWDGATR
jgi:predicted SnoaL-like aldol condensation-catalyzing enzyme